MGYVPFIVPVHGDSAARTGAVIGTVLQPGDPRNPFSTTRALLLDRWIATWIGMGAPDVLQLLRPRLLGSDLVQVLRIWRALLALPKFREELTCLHATCPHFLRQIEALHVRMLLMVLVHRLIRVDILHTDTLHASRVALPYFVQPNYEMAFEVQLTGKIHPWLRPSFTMNPQWLARRSRWSLTALHTMMCSLQRLINWDCDRPWVMQVSALQSTGLSTQSLYTRVPIGHVSSAPAVLKNSGVFADPTCTLLLPDAALNLVSLVRHQQTWSIYKRANKSELNHAGIIGLVQWRNWTVVPSTEPLLCLLAEEPMYAPTLPSTKKSSAMAHLREVHFEMYKRWLAMNNSKVSSTHIVYDAALASLETFMGQIFAGVFDWVTISMSEQRMDEFNSFGHVLLSQQPDVANPHFDFMQQCRLLDSSLVVELNE